MNCISLDFKDLTGLLDFCLILLNAEHRLLYNRKDNTCLKTYLNWIFFRYLLVHFFVYHTYVDCVYYIYMYNDYGLMTIKTSFFTRLLYVQIKPFYSGF